MRLIAAAAILAVAGVAGAGSYFWIPRLPLRLTIELDAPQQDLGAVFWRRGGELFEEERSTTFEVGAGLHPYTVALPAAVTGLRFDPGTVAGTFRVVAMQIDWLGLRLCRFDAVRGFGAWHAWHDIDEFAVRDGALRLVSGGSDPFLGIDFIPELSGRQARLRPWAAAGGATVGLLVALGVWWFGSRRNARPLPSVGAERAGRSPAAPPKSIDLRRRRLVLVTLSLLVSSAAAFVAYRAWTRRGHPGPVVATADYSLCVVDADGRLLGRHPGDVKLMLDPLVGYRNYPGQERPHFAIDDHGYRGGFDPENPRPRVMVLGGSTAFGHGLARDQECLSACLERLDPARQYVNAAVIGHLSGQELAELVHRGELIAPAVVVAFDGWNDFFVQSRPLPKGVDYGSNRDTQVALELALLDGYGSGARVAEPLVRLDPDAHRRQVVTAYTRNLARMASIARIGGARLLVAFQPNLDCKRHLTTEEARFSNPPEHQRYVEFLAAARAFCDAQGIAWVDLNDEPSLQEREDRLFFDRMHLTAMGTALVAEVIAAKLR